MAREPVQCVAEGCELWITSKADGHFKTQLCGLHHGRYRRHGDPNIILTGTRKWCSAADCTRLAKRQMKTDTPLCTMHHARLNNYGDANATPPLILRRDQVKGEPGGYQRVYRDGRWIQQHRAVMADMIGRPLKPYESVHHKNGKRDDNRPSNLELWSSRPQPPGQRVADLVAWAEEILDEYQDVADSMIRVDIYSDGTMEFPHEEEYTGG